MLPKEWSFTKTNQFWDGELFDTQKWQDKWMLT